MRQYKYSDPRYKVALLRVCISLSSMRREFLPVAASSLQDNGGYICNGGYIYVMKAVYVMEAIHVMEAIYLMGAIYVMEAIYVI